MKQNRIERGQAITFRIPSDTPDHILRQLQQLKETERRNFSSTIADYVIKGVSQSASTDRETLNIPLPKPLTKAQRDWVKHEYSEALLGSIIYQLITDPVRSSALLASMTSNSLDINEALYLQEQEYREHQEPETVSEGHSEEEASQDEHHVLADWNTMEQASDDDLDNISWENMSEELEEEDSSEEQSEVSAEDFLGGFLDKLNK
ncbi:hypothetical protein ACFFGV_12100 [Pontibacillus salicampi]|uniref:Plasmid segregation centromere-binding protein ParR n=1 Tax=Pontibacillus salicampi TaxID=1449801 RepID=A0ABV6LPU9_9BACI